jgi:hypothetical protein
VGVGGVVFLAEPSEQEDKQPLGEPVEKLACESVAV